jgi:hypothetical protein
MLLIIRCAGARHVLFVGLALLVGMLVLAAQGKPKKVLNPQRGPSTQEQRARNVERTVQEITRRRLHKERLIQALLAGRMRLLEVAARFRALDRDIPAFPWRQFRDYYSSDSDEERHCRQVIDFAHAALMRDLPRADEVRERLSAELREHLRRGPLRLPEVDCLDEED